MYIHTYSAVQCSAPVVNCVYCHIYVRICSQKVTMCHQPSWLTLIPFSMHDCILEELRTCSMCTCFCLPSPLPLPLPLPLYMAPGQGQSGPSPPGELQLLPKQRLRHQPYAPVDPHPSPMEPAMGAPPIHRPPNQQQVKDPLRSHLSHRKPHRIRSAYCCVQLRLLICRHS